MAVWVLLGRAGLTAGKLRGCICDLGHVYEKSQLGMCVRIPIMALLLEFLLTPGL